VSESSDDDKHDEIAKSGRRPTTTQSADDAPAPLGLKAVAESRAARGKKSDRKITGPTALIAGGAVLVVVLIAWLYSGRALNTAKADLLAQQRAAVKTVGAEWTPMRDRLEKLALDAAAGAYAGDQIDPEAAKWDFRSSPGIYLRLRVADAKDAASLRKAAKLSAKDAFTSCLMRENNPTIAAIAKGEDAGGLAQQDQPWNLRQAYAATRILTDEWIQEVDEAKDELRLRVFALQYERAKSTDIPLAIDIIKRAQFFLIVLDEDVPEAKELSGDAGKITEEALQQVAHPARVHIINLKTNKEMVRLQRTGDAGFVFAGERTVVDPEVRAAMKRQVNNCNLAQQVWAAIRPDEKPADKPSTDLDAGSSPSPSSAPSDAAASRDAR
jgi:hypothetical protein